MADARAEPSRTGEPGRGLRRELRFWEAIALSIGIMAPGAAMALNGTAIAARVGISVPLVFVFATLGVAFVAYAFVRLSAHFAHAGSVYAFSGATLGPRAGFLAGWALLGTYLAFTCASASEIGLFFGAFLDGVGIAHGVGWLWIALPALAIVAALAYGDVKVATRSLLSFEVVTVTLITVLIVVVLIKILAGDAPDGQDFTLDVFTANGSSFSALAAATVFAFLSFAGFEGAAALGEETDDPGRTIPSAIRRALIFTGVFYILCMFVQTIGFGATPEGAKAFASSPSPLGELGTSYIGSAFSDLINLGVAISAFASALGTAAGGSRILYALGRDGLGPPALGRTSARFGSPANALAVVIGVALVGMIAMWLNDTNAVNAFFYPGTIGVLSLIVAYALTNVGGLRFLFLAGTPRAPRWEAVFPVGALAFLVYVFYKNATDQVYPFNWFPWVVAVWLAVGLLVVLAVPGLAARIGRSLAAEQGLQTTGSPGAAG